MIHLYSVCLSHRCTPRLNIGVAPFTQVKQNRAPCLVQIVREVGVQLKFGEATGSIAVVALDKIDAPRSELGSVLFVVAKGARKPVAARRCADACVEANLEPQIVDVVRQCLHATRESRRIWLQVSITIACRCRPAVIHIYIFVTKVLHPRGNHRIGLLLDKVFGALVNQTADIVRAPRVPPHSRLTSHSVVVRCYVLQAQYE
mmetsp:Transcript_955/g.1043  ORF Transcript_955/g.1043 Transcript_955/m.1043 type:complete len:203 (-) Transcript_955:174-782(-)